MAYLNYLRSGNSTTKSAPPTTVTQKVAQFTDAAARWVQAGRPVRTSEEIQERYQICLACPFFRPPSEGFVANLLAPEGTCGKCGCAIAHESKTMNKLAWKTETCPDDPKRWE